MYINVVASFTSPDVERNLNPLLTKSIYVEVASAALESGFKSAPTTLSTSLLLSNINQLSPDELEDLPKTKGVNQADVSKKAKEFTKKNNS